MSAPPEAVVYSPRASVMHARDDGHCQATSRDGGKCGSYRRLSWFVPWYGWYSACYHCGAMHGGDQYLGKTDIRERWHLRLAEQNVEREAFAAKHAGDIDMGANS